MKFLSLQRDLYAYLHDQTLRMLNQGLVGPEIAEAITLPPAFEEGLEHQGLLRPRSTPHPRSWPSRLRCPGVLFGSVFSPPIGVMR